MFHFQRYRVALGSLLLAFVCYVCSAGASLNAEEFLVIAYPGPPVEQANLQRGVSGSGLVFGIETE